MTSLSILLPKERRRVLFLFFLGLLIVKIAYQVWQSNALHTRWVENGLFANNSEEWFWEGERRGLWLSIVPYGLLAVMAISMSRLWILGVASGLLLVAADVSVDRMFAHDPDGQVGIAIAIIYLGSFIGIVLLFLLVNYLVGWKGELEK